MKRFFCLICKKVKRTHSEPTLSSRAYAPGDGNTQVLQPDPRNRLGACHRHTLPQPKVEQLAAKHHA